MAYDKRTAAGEVAEDGDIALNMRMVYDFAMTTPVEKLAFILKTKEYNMFLPMRTRIPKKSSSVLLPLATSQLFISSRALANSQPSVVVSLPALVQAAPSPTLWEATISASATL